MDFNASVLITISRIVLAIIMVCAVLFQASIPFLLGMFFVASMTDWLDGFVARKLNQVTELGAYLDPVADKVLFVCGLFAFYVVTQDEVVALFGGLMVIREFIVSWLRLYLSRRYQGSQALAVSYFAKLKTTFQLLAIGYGFLSLVFSNIFPYDICHLLIVLAFIFSIISMFGYVKKFYQVLTISGKTP
jgi:CDP-diacylglycerol--glycerol-3-phosphate 3-phosphatidyltransferase